MAFGINDFARRSDLLLTASQMFQDSLGRDEADQDAATDELLGAAKPADSPILGLLAQPEIPSAASLVADDLAAVLLELQTGNLLVAAGLEQRRDEAGILNKASEQISTARADILRPVRALGVAATLDVHSATLESAKDTFRNYSDQFLREIVDEVYEHN